MTTKNARSKLFHPAFSSSTDSVARRWFFSEDSTFFPDGVSFAAALITAAPRHGFATADAVAGRLDEVTNGAQIGDLEIFLDMPEIAENGNQVKIAFEVDSPMTVDDHVKAVYVFADGNPEPDVAQFNFTPAMGACGATTRMRLSKTQNVTVLAAMSNGTFAKADTTVKVTIGGCGG